MIKYTKHNNRYTLIYYTMENIDCTDHELNIGTYA